MAKGGDLSARGNDYTRTALALHWLVALVIFAALPLGLYMHELPLSPRKLQLYSYHKWLGISALLLVLIRLAWRGLHRPPAIAATTPRWQQMAAHGTHTLLYLLMLIVPFSGWLMSSALGFPVVWFGVLPLPDLVGKDKELGEALKIVHAWLNYGLLTLVALHVAAALQHHFIERDDTLQRMLPFLRPRS